MRLHFWTEKPRRWLRALALADEAMASSYAPCFDATGTVREWGGLLMRGAPSPRPSPGRRGSRTHDGWFFRRTYVDGRADHGDGVVKNWERFSPRRGALGGGFSVKNPWVFQHKAG